MICIMNIYLRCTEETLHLRKCILHLINHLHYKENWLKMNFSKAGICLKIAVDLCFSLRPRMVEEVISFTQYNDYIGFNLAHGISKCLFKITTNIPSRDVANNTSPFKLISLYQIIRTDIGSDCNVQVNFS